MMTTKQQDAQKIADAFRQMFSAAMQINAVLGRNDELNDTVPAHWLWAECQATSKLQCSTMIALTKRWAV
jgi:hypothetical protein